MTRLRKLCDESWEVLDRNLTTPEIETVYNFVLLATRGSFWIGVTAGMLFSTGIVLIALAT